MNKNLVCLVGLVIWYYTVFAEGRQKRVINGEELMYRSSAAYAAVKYFVWIGYGRSVSSWEFFLPPREWKFDREVCGGALLTVTIIQTACHCFSDFLSPRHGYGWAELDDHNYEIVTGWNEVNDAPQPYGIVKYLIHPRCAQVYWVEEDHAADGWVTHDFALATLETHVQLTSIVTTAPLYPVKEMAEMWGDAIAKEAVCLLIGFGRYISRKENIKSRVLRHGWQSLTSYKDCYTSTRIYRVNLTRYQEDASWSCMLPFGPRRTLSGKGDSGSPITCDNRYFSIVSGTDGSIDVYVDLIYFALANAKEYRDEMVYLMDPDADQSTVSIDPPPDRWTPGTAPPNFFVAASSSGYALKSSHLVRLIPFSASLVAFQH